MDRPNAKMIAPCGMDCALCVAHQRDKKQCAGCRGDDGSQPKHCAGCAIKNCPVIGTSGSGFCYGCEKFPCRRLKQLDARYRADYGMSMVENLAYLRDKGMGAFLEWEAERWTCESCGRLVCVHRDACLRCGAKRE